MNQQAAEQFETDGYALAQGIYSEEELTALRAEMSRMVDGAPVDASSGVDRFGNEVPYPADFGYSDLDNGQKVLSRISNQLARSSVMRIAYGNPELLRLVESVYGAAFVPFAESVIVKLEGNGAEIPYHQDGNRWDGIEYRGLNIGIYLHASSEANGCLRVIPGSHRGGKVDVHALRDAHGPILPGSIPLLASPGDLSIHDRSLIHGSLPNASADLRITVYFGFHKLETVEPIHQPDHIRRRAQVVSLCIRERRQSGLYPTETPYAYALSALAPVPASQDEIDIVLRTPALGL